MCDTCAMTDRADAKRRRSAVKLSDLVGGVLDPVTARRGFGTADMIATWPQIVGTRVAQCTRPEKIVWPRGEAAAADGGVLHLRVEGPRAVLIQHELDQIMERVNAFLGYAAVTRVRLVQAPVAAPHAQTPGERPPDPAREARINAVVAGVEDDRLKAALDRLGRGVVGRR
jgi:hypothetical protein